MTMAHTTSPAITYPAIAPADVNFDLLLEDEGGSVGGVTILSPLELELELELGLVFEHDCDMDKEFKVVHVS